MCSRCCSFYSVGRMCSTLPLSFSVMLCSSFDIGPKQVLHSRTLPPPLTTIQYPFSSRMAERVSSVLIFVSTSWLWYLWRVLLPRTVRRSPSVLIVLAVSRQKVKSGLKAGRQAARIPTYIQFDTANLPVVPVINNGFKLPYSFQIWNE
jgi:hypothetical protein